MTDNPLSGYFRKPAVHMTLPTGGKFYAEGSLQLPPTLELPVYPMSSLDEISYKTPDALFNGSAITDVIKSCVPGIIDPWQIPITDLSTILISIRLASFGHTMEINTSCPKCGEESTYGIDLRAVIDSITSPDFDKPLKIGDLLIFFKPISYAESNKNNKINFEEQQITKSLITSDADEAEKIKLIGEAFRKISKFSIESFAHNINVIRTPESDVTEFEYILDFLRNCEREIYKAIKDKILEMREMSEIKPLKIICDNAECKLEYEQPFTMDMTNFFE